MERPKQIGWSLDLQMPIYEARKPDMGHLKFLRDLAEKGKFSVKPYSQPRGGDVFRLTDEEIKQYVMKALPEPVRPLLEHIANTGGY